VVSSLHFLHGEADKLIDAVRQAQCPLRGRWRCRQSRQRQWRQADRCGGVLNHTGPSHAPGAVSRRSNDDVSTGRSFRRPRSSSRRAHGRFQNRCRHRLTRCRRAKLDLHEDYAVALVDEIEQPRHSRRRFTVGY
jgi:hypothetical protein